MWIWQKNLMEGLEKWKFWNLWILLTFLCFPTPALAPPMTFTFPDTHGLAFCPGIPRWSNALAHLFSPEGCFPALPWASTPLEGIPEPSHPVSCFSSGAPQLPVLLTIIMLILCIIMICIQPSQTESLAKLGSMSYSWLNLQAWGTVITQQICWINELVIESMYLWQQLLPTEETKGPTILIDYTDSSWSYFTTGSRLGHVYSNSLEPCLHRLAHMVLFVLSLKENAAAEQGTWWWVSLQNRAGGTKPRIHFAQWGKGSFVLLVTSSLIHNHTFQMQTAYCNLERYSLWQPI